MSSFNNLAPVVAFDCVGQHYLVELIDCDLSVIDNEFELREYMLQAVELSGATIIKDVFHKFAPQGVTGVVVIAESHVSVHTWPELGYAAVDIFTCTPRMNTSALIAHLQKKLNAQTVHTRHVPRGPTISKHR